MSGKQLSLVKIKNICLKSNIYQSSDNITIGLWYLTDRMLLDIGWLVDHLMHIDYNSEVYHIEINDLSDQELFWAISRAIACWLDILHINYLWLIICVFGNFNSLINNVSVKIVSLLSYYRLCKIKYIQNDIFHISNIYYSLAYFLI